MQRPAQGMRGMEQPRAQVPPLQTSLLRQARPQAPQWPGSVAVSTQAPAHKVAPAAQVSTQLPPVHTWAPAQAWPHIPQLEELVWRSTHDPEQRVWPAGQPQAPAMHEAPPVQVTPQPLQLAGSVAVFTQLPPQVVEGAWQTATQPPPLQD